MRRTECGGDTISDYLCYRFNLIPCTYLLEFDLDSVAEFFAQLSTKVRVLALNSSLVDLVHYTRQGLQRLKQSPKGP
jgi:hypothetical protein